MKKFWFGLLAICLPLLSSQSHAGIENAPYPPEIDSRFCALEGPGHFNPSSCSSPGADAAAGAVHVAQATYDFSVQGGALGEYNLGITIPAKATVVKSYEEVITSPTTSAAGVLGFKCTNPGDLGPSTVASSYPTAPSTLDGVTSRSASTFIHFTSACNIKAGITTGALTAGKVTMFVEYIIHK